MKRLSILIVAEAPAICSLLSLWLRAHHSVCVNSGTEACSAVSLLNIDLVIADIHVRDVTGLDIIPRIKRAQPWIRILGISGGFRHQSPRACLSQTASVGADTLILEPFDEHRLLAAMRECWEGASRYEEPSRLPPVSRPAPLQSGFRRRMYFQ
jgi:CheY-like chemotaxis protein